LVEGATERGRASEQGCGLEKARARGGVAGNRADLCASTARSTGSSEGKGPRDRPHGSERERASERVSALTSGDHRTERASVHARTEPTPTGPPHREARGERGERGRALDELTGGGHLSGRASARAQACARGWAGWT
jgi:hypothetical protein